MNGAMFQMLAHGISSAGMFFLSSASSTIELIIAIWCWQRVFLGVNPATANYPDVSAREAVVLASFCALAIALGIFPQTLVLVWMEPSVTGLVESLARLKP
jgi:NADH-quinone oxidoreductase subunit M